MGITFERVGMEYQGQAVLANLHLSLHPGTTAVMGRNSAGKTTFLQLAAGILSPSQGEIRLDGQPYSSSKSTLLQSLGYLPQDLDFPEHLTPRQLLTYLARLRFCDPRQGMQALDLLGLTPLADRRFASLSAGEIRLVGLAQALMGGPRFLILDEFSRSLGAEDRQRVYSTLIHFSVGRTLLFSTHLCDDVEALAERVILLDGGRVTFDGHPAAMIRAAVGHVHRISLPPDPSAWLQAQDLCVSRTGTDGGQNWAHIVGRYPEGVSAQPICPNFEEACLWFFQSR